MSHFTSEEYERQLREQQAGRQAAMVSPLKPLLSYGWKKDLILVRGLPGSGKSTLAGKLVGPPPVPGFLYSDDRVIEADQYFVINGKYDWHPALREMAHEWCLAETFRKLRLYDRVAVANTFVQRWTLLKYVEQARRFQVRVWLFEAPGNGLTPMELSTRNVHGVPAERIEQMMIEWEEMSQEEINIILGLHPWSAG